MVFSQNAKWIGTGAKLDRKTTNTVSPALRLLKEFEVEQYSEAVCYICGLGSYLLYINGKRVGDEVLSPAFTNYDKRALYLRHDLTQYIQKGKNLIAVELGDGFFNQTTHDQWGFFQATWRDHVRMIFELFIDSKSVVVSDESWVWSLDGPTIHTAMRTGEYYDARKQDGWMNLGYDHSNWHNARRVAPIGGKLVLSEIQPMRELEELKIVKKWKSANGWIVDFGKNIAGYIAVNMKGERGKTLRFRYQERLKDGEPDRWDIARYIHDTDAFSEDRYTFAGAGEKEFWKPSFVYHGFRFVEILGLDCEPEDDCLIAYFVHTDLPRKGCFSCSDELLNWLYDAGIRSYLSNWHGFSEDCPHREKNGWTGDAVISCDYAVCNFDMKQAYKKWLADICDCQRDNGMLPGIAPTSTWGYNWGNGPAWDCAIFFIPYILYLETGDSECFEVVFNSCERYLDYALYYRNSGLVCYGLADWAPPQYADGRTIKLMPNELSDSCYYYAMQSIFAAFCKMKGDLQKYEKYSRLAKETKDAIISKYINGIEVANNSQGALAEVLYFKIVDGEQAVAIAKHLNEVVKQSGFFLETGILGLKALLNALSAYGYTESAYKVVSHYDYPSYGYWKNCGATTLWENWNGVGSQNHHMYADVLNWMYRNILGIKNCDIAYKKCVFEPYFYAKNCTAEGKTITPYGEISIKWQKVGNELTVFATVPESVEMTAIIKGVGEKILQTGVYKFNLNND